MKNATGKKARTAIAVAISVGFVVGSLAVGDASAVATGESIAVNFAVTHGSPQYFGAGLLHGINNRAPAPSNLSPLKPNLWRLGLPGSVGPLTPSYDYFDVQARTQNNSPQQEQVVMSDYRGESPYSGMTWNAMCQSLVTRAGIAGLNPVWDLLNEPDNSSWTWLSSSPTDWDACYDGVKAANPTAKTDGPSISSDNIANVETFLLNQKAKGRLPDIVTWHFPAPQNVESEVSTLRTWMASNGISPRPISIQEVLFPADAERPGSAVGYFAAAERAQVPIAHACWNESAPPNNNTCMQPMLDGLLTADGQRRGEWYAYADYSQMSGTLVDSVSSTIANVDGITTTDSAKATILVGAVNSWSGTVSLNLSNLTSSGFLGSSSGSVRVVVQDIPDGTSAADQTVTSNTVATYSGNALTLSVPIAQYHAARVTVLPAASSFVDNIEYPSALPTALPTVAIRGSGNNLFVREYNGNWGSWQNLGGTMASDPAVDVQNQNNVDIWYRGTDGRLKQVYNLNAGWVGVVDFAGPTGGAFVGDPSAVSWGSGNVTVAVRGTDNVLYTKTFTGGTAGSWVNTGVALAGDPAIESQGPNLLDVFWTGSTGTLKQVWNTGSGWSATADIGGSIVGKPSAAAWGFLDVTVAARGTNGNVWVNAYHATGWSGWTDLGYATSASPSIAIQAINHRDLYFANGGSVYQLWNTGSGWTGPFNAGGSPAGSPASIG